MSTVFSAPLPSPLPAPVRMPTEERQALIVAAAIDLAGRISPGAITTADIAREIGLTQGALFKHFPSKEAIWVAVMDSVTTQLLGRLEAAATPPWTPTPAAAPTDAGGPALGALSRVFHAHIAFVQEHPGVPRLIFHDLQQPADSPLKQQLGMLMQRYRQLLTRLLQAAVADGEATAELDIGAASTAFIGLVQGLAMQSLLVGSADALTLEAGRVLPLFIRSIRRTP